MKKIIISILTICLLCSSTFAVEGTNKTIKIAPNVNEVSVVGNEIRTDFAGGIVYKADGIEKYKDEYLVEVFRTAIAITSRMDQLEWILNGYLGLKGMVNPVVRYEVEYPDGDVVLWDEKEDAVASAERFNGVVKEVIMEY